MRNSSRQQEALSQYHPDYKFVGITGDRTHTVLYGKKSPYDLLLHGSNLIAHSEFNYYSWNISRYVSVFT